jgi:hypothetical protein
LIFREIQVFFINLLNVDNLRLLLFIQWLPFEHKIVLISLEILNP